MDILKPITEPETHRNAPDIAAMIDTARRAGVYFPHDPSGNGDVQIRVNRDATPEGHRLVAILCERRDEVNAHFKLLRPAWPKKDDGWAPRLDPDEPDATIFLIKLEEVLAEDRIADFIESEVSYVGERIAGIVARSVAARRTAAPVNTTIRLRKHEPDRVVY